METLKKKTTKKEQQELLLRETKKTLQRELARLKGRKILTPEELIKMKEARQWWNERINNHPGIPQKFTPLEELQFEFWRAKRRLVGPIVERMIFHCKSGPYDQSLKELEYFEIDVRDLLLRMKRLKEERDRFYKKVDELQNELISLLKKESRRLGATLEEQGATLEARNATIKEQNLTIDAECKRIRSSSDYDEHMEAQLQEILSGSDSKEEGPLRVV